MRLRIAWLALLAAAPGCPAAQNGSAGGGAGVAEVPATTPVPSGSDERALYEGFTRDHPWRAVLARIGRWRLTPLEEWREPAAGSGEWAPFDVIVADSMDDAVRVVGDAQDMLFAAWVPREDLAEVPVQPLVLGGAPGEAPAEGEPGVRLAGGAPVDVLERRDGWVRVKVSVDDGEAEGWMPSVLLGRAYRWTDFETSSRGFTLEPDAALEVHESPSGRAIATIRSGAGEGVRVRAVSDEVTPEGWRRVEWVSPRLRVDGWVPADRLSPASAQEPPGWGRSVAGRRVRGDFHWLTVPIGTEVRVTPDGEVVAVTLQGTKFAVMPDRAPKVTAVLLRTIWGEVTAWVACDPIPEGMAPPLIDSCIPPIEF